MYEKATLKNHSTKKRQKMAYRKKTAKILTIKKNGNKKTAKNEKWPKVPKNTAKKKTAKKQPLTALKK